MARPVVGVRNIFPSSVDLGGATVRSYSDYKEVFHFVRRQDDLLTEKMME